MSSPATMSPPGTQDEVAAALCVSVVIPAHNGAARLPTVLAALSAQTLPRDEVEISVVDDGSTDDASAVAAALGARVVRPPHNVGQGAATNLGIAAATAPVIAFTDDDTIPEPQWLEQGLRAIADSPGGLVAGHVELVLPERPTVAAQLEFGRGYLDQCSYVADGFGATANLWATREVLDRLGGFNGDAAWQTHDRDFGERAREAGIELVYSERPVVRHPTRSDPRAFARVAYRLGLGGVWLARHSTGGARAHRPEWTRPRYWLPWRSIWGLERLQRQGHATTAPARMRLLVAQFVLLQVPLVAGSAVGSLREWRRERRARRAR